MYYHCGPALGVASSDPQSLQLSHSMMPTSTGLPSGGGCSSNDPHGNLLKLDRYHPRLYGRSMLEVLPTVGRRMGVGCEMSKVVSNNSMRVAAGNDYGLMQQPQVSVDVSSRSISTTMSSTNTPETNYA